MSQWSTSTGGDGNFYGTTEYNGFNNYVGYVGFGTVFKITTNEALTTLYAFGSVTNANGNLVDGANPSGQLALGRDGSFYGTTSFTVFRLTIVPEFRAVTLANNMLNLTWSTEAGRTYQLQVQFRLEFEQLDQPQHQPHRHGSVPQRHRLPHQRPAALLPPSARAVSTSGR